MLLLLVPTPTDCKATKDSALQGADLLSPRPALCMDSWDSVRQEIVRKEKTLKVPQH